jgi:ferredoxin
MTSLTGCSATTRKGCGRVRGDGIVPPGQEQDARLAALNCPEHAIGLLEEA